MFNFQTLCPVCLTDVTSWASRCPKCHYHPDSYNRAQDDVALIARYRANDGAWRRHLPTWLGGATATQNAATIPVESRPS
jgi:predicted amidophosphoribosyltransferase